MTSDRELLELAAKAVGLKISWRFPVGSDLYLLNPDPELPNVRFSPEFIDEEGFSVKWNPLADDGDALQLAVKLHMKVYPGEAYGWDGAIVDYSHKFSGVCDETEEPDPYAATRRAITRAAAEIGEAMEAK